MTTFVSLIVSMILIIIVLTCASSQPMAPNDITLWIGFFFGGLYGWFITK
jgi:hypothetical protein